MKLSYWGWNLKVALVIILLPVLIAQSNQTEANQNQEEKETNHTVTLIWTIVAIGLLISACVFSALLYRNYFGPCDMGFGMGGAASAAGSNATSQTNPVQQIFAMPGGSQPLTFNGGDKNNTNEERDRKTYRDPDLPPPGPHPYYYPYCAPMPMYPPPLPYPHPHPGLISPKSSRYRHVIPMNTPSPSLSLRPPRTVSTVKTRSTARVKTSKASSGEESSTSSRKSNRSRATGNKTFETSRSVYVTPMPPSSHK